MKVLALRADMGGCAKYRLEEPIKLLSEQYGWDIKIDNDISVDAERAVGTRSYVVHEVKEDVDLIVIQRPLRQSVNAVVTQAQKQGIAVIVELDDDLENTHRQNFAWKKVSPDHSPYSNWEWLRKTASVADLVTVSTSSLLHYAPEGRGVVLPNCIPDREFDTNYTHSRVSGLGWSGTTATHPGDLEVVGDGVAHALKKAKQDFHVVGDGIGVREALGLPYSIDMHTTGWVELDDYYRTMKSVLKVGIVPLEDNKFNHGKSHLKGIEMAALGIPFVASPTPEYIALAELGIGQIAENPDDWARLLIPLLTKPQKAYMLGQRYRSEVKKRYVYSQFADSWKSAWEAAVAHRKASDVC